MSEDRKAREKILARVRALLSMTTENGCTEAEAMTAAAHAAKLMEEHDLAVSDLEALKAEPITTDTRGYGKTRRSKELHPAARHASVAIANFFDCRVWYHSNTISFFGMKDDVGLAHDLLKLVQSAMDRELSNFKANGLVEGGPGIVAQSNSFCVGMSVRVSERLSHMKASRTAAVKAKGMDLVVIKAEIVTAAHAKMFGPSSLKRARARRDPSSDAAYAAGYHAGDRVGLGQKEIVKPNFDSRTRRQRVHDAYTEYSALLRERERGSAASPRQGAFTAGTDSNSAMTSRPTLRDAIRRDLIGWRDFLMRQTIFAFTAGFFLVGLRYFTFEGVSLFDRYGQFNGLGLVVVTIVALCWMCIAATLRTMIHPSDEDLPRNPVVMVAYLVGTGTATCGLVWRRLRQAFRPAPMTGR